MLHCAWRLPGGSLSLPSAGRMSRSRGGGAGLRMQIGELVARHRQFDFDVAAAGQARDAVQHRVLQQRLQHQPRHRQRARAAARPAPVDAAGARPGAAARSRGSARHSSTPRPGSNPLSPAPSAARNRSDRSSTARSATTGSLRTRPAMVFMLLKRKCGLIRACSASASARALARTCACQPSSDVEVAQHHGDDQHRHRRRAPDEADCIEPLRGTRP